MGLRGQMALLGISGVLVTGAICAAALNYASIVQNESSDANRFRIRVTSLSQGFLQSRQIASDFLRKPSEVSIKSHDEKYERQLADLSSVETFAAALSGDDPLKEATSMRTVINSMKRAFTTSSRANATLASMKMTVSKASCAGPFTAWSSGWLS